MQTTSETDKCTESFERAWWFVAETVVLGTRYIYLAAVRSAVATGAVPSSVASIAASWRARAA